jgi:DNA-binding MurR/RpiR family transcriptional regulator
MLDQIRAKQAALAPAEARVAQWLLQQPAAFLQTAVARIAQEAQVSQPTVVRFCRSMGAQGLREFKLTLAASLSQQSAGPHPSVKPNDNLAEIKSKVIQSGVQALQSLTHSLALETLEPVVQALLQAKRIDFVGVGQSALVAQDAKQKFFRFGMICEAHADPALQVMSASLLSRNDVLVLISASGRSPELSHVAGVARAAGARVVFIGPPNNAMHTLADWCLQAPSLEDPNIHLPMLGRMQHLMIIDVLAVAYSQHLDAKGRQRLADIKNALHQRNQYRPLIKKV